MQKQSPSKPDAMAIFYDFQAAFPSVCHGFLFKAMKALGTPPGVLASIKHLHTCNQCSMIVGGTRVEGV